MEHREYVVEPLRGQLPRELVERLGGAGVADILDSLAEAVTIRDAHDRLLYANRAAVRSMGFQTLEEMQAHPLQEIFSEYEVRDEHGQPLTMGDIPSVRLLSGQPGEPLIIRTTHRSTGRRQWQMLKASPLRAPDGQAVATVMIIEDITTEKLSEQRDRFLARASDTLMSSLDYQETLTNVAWLAVPEVADWCAVDLVDASGERDLVAVAHRDPSKAGLAAELARLRPTRPEPGGAVARVLATGAPELYPHVEIAPLPPETSPESLRYRQLLAEVGLHSVIVCPLRARGRTLGTMTLINAESRRAFDEGDLIFAQELAARAGVAVDNARLATARRATAVTLQESLLPARLPDIPGWRVAGLYRPGATDEEIEVGGDFYDLFETEAGWMVLLGDVTGKGTQAAAMTGLVRHGARFLGRHNPDPSAIFRQIDEALRERDELSLCTALCARLGSDHVWLSSAGHPAPLILRDDGSLREVGSAGQILGAWPDGTWPASQVPLGADETLILYTDGVTDVPGPVHAGDRPPRRERFGLERLLRVLGSAAGGSPDELLAALEAELTAFHRGGQVDDTAVLILRPAG
ncbi:MAG TPA: SpoIIE family protein phosphatase [Solirubrobacteraceae bacterium]|nr:SpoIIE family protein phosphatase [Solirubrobacteraceae bacterium]